LTKLNLIQFKKLEKYAIIPTKAHRQDAGFDLHSIGSYRILPGERVVISTGIAYMPPEGFAGFVWPRSGLASNRGLDVLGGLIDGGYRGEIKVILVNHGYDSVFINKGDRVAQLVVSPYFSESEEVDSFVGEADDRGTNGFGSSGD
jgi:dUTP pyrophosphatase